MTEEEALQTKGIIYRHYKGGIYRFITIGKETGVGADVVIYEHLWPHERGVWVRPYQEFYSYVPVEGLSVFRFQLVTINE